MTATLELVPLQQDTARFVDRRIGFSMCVPGHPALLPVAATSGVSEPTYEARVQLADVPVSVRYRHNEQPAGMAAHVPVLVQTYAANRCRREDLPRAQSASPEQCRAWGVEAAASAIYPLREPDADGNDMEELLVLARGTSVVTLTKRFARATMSWVSWSLCNSAIAAGIRWDASALDATPPLLWPPSTFLQPGVLGVLAPGRRAAAAALAALAAPHPTASVRLADALALLLRGGEPPSHRIAPQERAAFETYLGDRAGDPALANAIAALLAEVETAHDLRGLALLVLHALGKVPGTFGSSSEDDRRAFGHVAD